MEPRIIFFYVFCRWTTKKPFEEICKNEKLERDYRRRYSDTFCTFTGHGCDEKGNAAKYWSNCDITKLDFFGKYLSRNSYQMLISNIHCAPNYQNPPKGKSRP